MQANPPAARTIQLAKLAEEHGFSHFWTFDSHLLWQEPYVIYSRILAETHKIMVGPMVTNPATRDWTVTASTYATLNEMYGKKGVIQPGADGDIVVYDPNGHTSIGVGKTHHMNMDYSAYEGFEIDGHVDTVLSRGKVIVDNNEYVGAKGDGKYFKRGLSQYLI